MRKCISGANPIRMMRELREDPYRGSPIAAVGVTLRSQSGAEQRLDPPPYTCYAARQPKSASSRRQQTPQRSRNSRSA
jgi:hypothetical protein